MPVDIDPADSREWVERRFLGHAADRLALQFGAGGPGLTAGQLRTAVLEESARLTGERAGAPAGVGGRLVLVQAAPAVESVVAVLAAWHAGAGVALVDHRLTAHELSSAVERLRPALVLHTGPGSIERHRAEDGAPPAPAFLTQLSSGSTGASKVVGRGLRDLDAELERYRVLDGMPADGEALLVLSSLTHTYGFVGGLLHGLAVGCPVAVPARPAVDDVARLLAVLDRPTTVLGVPFHVQLLATASARHDLGRLRRVVNAGDLLRADVAERFAARHDVPLGEIYGMTETGLLAADLSGASRPAVGRAAAGVRLQVRDGELLVGLDRSPYVLDPDGPRFRDGWLHTRDAATLDAATGLLRLAGRLDSQVAVGGLKVDLTEVEHLIGAVDDVAAAVVVHDGDIRAYVEPAGDGSGTGDGAGAEDTAEQVRAAIRARLGDRLAAYKHPRHLHVLSRLPRTSTGKPVRDPAALRQARSTAEAR